MVGTLAFVIDASLLRLLLLVGFGFYSGRAVSFLVVATGTWILNRSFTFRGNIGRGKLRGEWAGYLGLMALGGAVNYGVYALAIENSALIRQHPELGVALGALAGMMINYWSARTWFRRNGQPGGKTSGRP
ncbi:MAG TPA: GtrA family protein [Dongiaceae bacterium]